MKNLMQKLILGIINIYRKYISPLKPPSCRFTPTCSTYTFQAVEKFGVLKGLFLGTKRILRCHPMNPGGNDPVPEEFTLLRRNKQ